MDELSLEIVVEVEQYIAYKRVNKGDKTILLLLDYCDLIFIKLINVRPRKIKFKSLIF